MLHVHGAGTGQGADNGFRLLGLCVGHVQVRTVKLDGNVSLSPRHEFVKAQLNGLTELQADAGKYLHGLFQRLEHPLPVRSRGPFVPGFHHQGIVTDLHRHGVGRDFGGADVGNDFLHLGELVEYLALYPLG